MGGPCLGIVPVSSSNVMQILHESAGLDVLMRECFLQPSIEEFNHPMPENCAGGNTGIFVNGRELNAKDLDLLSSRGLPTERDRSYIIEISGRVWDEETGEELDCLGKLAPT